MRFSRYIELSSKNDNDKDFRMLKIGVISKKNVVVKIDEILSTCKEIKSIQKDIELINSILPCKDQKIGLCVDNSDISLVDSSKLSESRKDRMKIRLYELADKLAKIQKNYEKELRL
jgi:hypothetical protein